MNFGPSDTTVKPLINLASLMWPVATTELCTIVYATLTLCHAFGIPDW